MTAVAEAPAAEVVVEEPLVRVVVKMGEHVIADWTGPASKSQTIANAWGRRWGLGATVRPVDRAGVEWT